ncbi:autophagy protein Apg5-domain-containing protein [Lipomyces japonicus]|uniref:autophagy protein Apg5-domain-containing protein n=1 Tax=Lipomyces japonicus TaxID=56871 RepID=UPI0034CD8B7E
MSLINQDAVDIRRKIWDGIIPIRIVLAPDEAREIDTVEPFYFNAPRVSYLPLYYNQIISYFKPFLRDASTADSFEWWLEFENVPLKWNLPIGLAYDIMTGLDPTQVDHTANHELSSSSLSSSSLASFFLPWSLVFHYNNYPQSLILRLPSINIMMNHWINLIKEADFIRRGNANMIMSLSKTDSDDLWSAVVSHNFETFWKITRKVLPPDPCSSLRNVPIKIYLPSGNKVLQSLVSPMISSREPHTVGTALHQHLPHLFPSRRTCLLARPILHGVVVGMTTPLADLLYECMYTDGYLHIAISMIS